MVAVRAVRDVARLVLFASVAAAPGCGGGTCEPPSSIAFAATRNPSSADPTDTHLLVQRLDGVSGPDDLDAMVAPTTYVASPDGSHLLVVRDVAGSGEAAAWTVARSGAGARLAAAPGAFPLGLVGWYGETRSVVFQETDPAPSSAPGAAVRWIRRFDAETGVATRLQDDPESDELWDVRTSPDGRSAILRFLLTGGLPDSFRFESFDLTHAVAVDEQFGPGQFLATDSTPRWSPDSRYYYFVRDDGSRTAVDAEGTFPASVAAPGGLYEEPASAEILEFVLAPTPVGASRAETGCAYVRRRTLVPTPPSGPLTVDELVVDRLDGSLGAPSFPFEGTARVEEITYDPLGLAVWVGLGLTPVGGGAEVRTVQVFDRRDAHRLAEFHTFMDELDFDRRTGDVAILVRADGQDPVLSRAGIWLVNAFGAQPRRIDTGPWIPTGAPRFLLSTRRYPGMAGDGTIR